MDCGVDPSAMAGFFITLDIGNYNQLYCTGSTLLDVLFLMKKSQPKEIGVKVIQNVYEFLS
ncbi:hypothetical protein AB7Y92_19745 [Providencia manganoxydans]|uniref:hypothetical protein n=1 Tax=Providencia manganoxydans TaxID=2923283 RepID=UPI0034E4448B